MEKDKDYRETKINSFFRKNKSLCLILTILLVSSFVYATIISDTSISSTQGNFSKLIIGKGNGTNEVNLSGVVYVNSTSGFVGIGTTTPQEKLNVRGVGNFSGTIYINNGTDVSTLVDGNPFDQSLNITDDVQFQLTTTGQLIINGMTQSQNITPITNLLYSLGNSTNWFKNIFVNNVYATIIDTTNLTAMDVQSEKVNATNLTVGGYDVYKDGSGDLNINLD